MITYFAKRGMKEKEIQADFQNTLGNSSPPYSTVEFNFGQESLEDDLYSDQSRCQKLLQKYMYCLGRSATKTAITC